MAVYTNTTDVRMEAGLTDNIDILDATITQYILESHSIILGKIASNFDTSLLDVSNTNFINSTAHIYLAKAEKLMTAGYLLLKEYGAMIGDNKNADAEMRLKQADKMLEDIASGSVQLILLDGTTAPFKGSTSNVRTYGAIYIS
jgi:hypothetical protein